MSCLVQNAEKALSCEVKTFKVSMAKCSIVCGDLGGRIIEIPASDISGFYLKHFVTYAGISPPFQSEAYYCCHSKYFVYVQDGTLSMGLG